MATAVLSKPKPPFTTCTLTEFVSSSGQKLRVDKEAGVIHGVKILGLESKNGRSYLDSALSEAVALYEGAKVNLNHPKGRADQPRDYQDRIGSLKAVEHRGGDGLFGNLHYNPKHPSAAQLEWDAEHAPANVGLSHNALARTATRNGRLVVESIQKVNSVDLVADPATTAGLYEHTEPEHEGPEMALETVTLEQFKATRKDLYEQVLAEQAASEEAKAKDAELKAVKEELDRHKSAALLAERTAKVEQAITEAKLPTELVSDLFKQQCLEAKDATALAALIEDRRTLIKVKPVVKPKSTDQTPIFESLAINNTDDFVSALKAYH